MCLNIMPSTAYQLLLLNPNKTSLVYGAVMLGIKKKYLGQ